MPAVPGLRSPYEPVGGLLYFGRMVDKIRLRAAGKLPEAYQPLVGDTGDPTAFDGRICRFLGLRHAELEARVLAGDLPQDDDALLAWALEQGGVPAPWWREAFNAFLVKRGWRDSAAAGLREQNLQAGFNPARVLTFFDFIETDEERPLFFGPEALLARVPPRPLLAGLRSPYETVGGLYHFGRMIDKMRLHAAGKLPQEWHNACGASWAYDGLTCSFLGIAYGELKAEALRGGADEDLLAWAHTRGRVPGEEELLIWNAYMSKRNWRDGYTPRLHYRLQREGLPATAARTMFDYIDLDEGRPLRFED
jgi:hypothetical protein